MAANPYIRRKRKLALRAAGKTVLGYGVGAGLCLLGYYFAPNLLHYVSVVMWILMGGLAVMGTYFSIRHSRKISRARSRLATGQCPECGYDRTGLQPDDACPECASPNAVVDPEAKPNEPAPAPKGKPVCVHCGRDMTGREKRTCPDCGVMYGIDYFEE